MMNAGGMMDLAKRPDPNCPTYRKPVMIGSTAGLTERGQFPEYEAWIARRIAQRSKSDAKGGAKEC